MTHSKRVGETATKRRPLSAKTRQALSDSQGGLCFYCFNAFGAMYQRGSVIGYLTMNVDHAVPYSYVQANETPNLVAACHVCNMLKSNKMFDTVEEARAYVEASWQRKKISLVP